MNSAQPTIIGARNSNAEILEGVGLIATDKLMDKNNDMEIGETGKRAI